jgi:predicted Zn-dependent peptidase
LQGRGIKLFLQTTLANGLTIIAERWTGARSVAIGAFVRAGARDEAPAQNGISHFLEHLCFKGSVGESPQSLNAAFDAIGSRADAFTTQELTAYHGAALPESQARLMELLLGLLRPALREDDVNMERQVILEEIEMYRDDPGSVIFEAAARHFYGAHPYARSVLGTPETLEGLGSAQINRYLEDWYAPDKIVVTACGNLDWYALVAQVAALTANWQPSGVQRIYPPLEPRAGGQRLVRDVTRAQAALLSPGFAAQDSLHMPAGVLAQIVGESNSRLYWALVDDGLCDDASLEHAAEDGLGAFYGSLSTDPADLDAALERYEDVLNEVQKNGVTETELARTKKKLEVGLALRFETPHSRLLSLAEDFIALNEYRSVPDLLAEVRGVSMEQIHAVLEHKPFDTLSITTLTPPLEP